jgi:hypothetical protein
MNILTELVKLVKTEVEREYIIESPTGNCIISSAVLHRVLTLLGMKSQPLSVRVIAYNKPMMELLKEGKHPLPQTVEEMDKIGGWSVGVGYGDPNPGCWPGHLAVRVGNTLIDITIDTASRPNKNMVINEPLISIGVSEDFFTGKEDLWLTDENGILLIYRAFPDDDSYKVSPNWCGKKHAPVKDMIVERIIWRWSRMLKRNFIKK